MPRGVVCSSNAHVLLCTLRASKSGFLAVNEKSCVSVLENDKNTRGLSH